MRAQARSLSTSTGRRTSRTCSQDHLLHSASGPNTQPIHIRGRRRRAALSSTRRCRCGSLSQRSLSANLNDVRTGTKLHMAARRSGCRRLQPGCASLRSRMTCTTQLRPKYTAALKAESGNQQCHACRRASLGSRVRTRAAEVGANGGSHVRHCALYGAVQCGRSVSGCAAEKSSTVPSDR
jgi:hypothetical protein